MANRLAAETSPYLRQHADNPVHWQPWDAAALAQARAEDKPILLSIGYSACHWCHVMAHECFEDPEVAALMNRLFINIKVDREERPDLDQIYQLAQQILTGQSGGWPLTMFLTPDGQPFYGGTYFPKQRRYGRPGLPELCENIAATYRQRDPEIRQQNAALREALENTLPSAGAVANLDDVPIAWLRNHLLNIHDSRDGGFGGAPKFPHAPDLALLLDRHVAHGDGEAGAAALLTLGRMARGGLYDQLGGGFFRYSVDERWEIPHFEKMLYDNGLLLGLYADAWAASGDPLFARAAEGIARWVMTEMQSPDGGYYAALDADSEGEEGKFYVWQREEVRALLDDGQWRVAAAHWGLDQPPNFENRHWHLKVAEPLAPGEEEALAAATRILLTARGERVPPGLDDKILTGWNALMIRGLVRAARVFDRSDWLASARRALEFIRQRLWQGDHLLATLRPGLPPLGAYLDDHAFLLEALLEMFQADFRSDDLDFARQLADALLERFEDREAGGLFFTAHDHETLIHRPKPGHDNATPSGNGVAARALQRLGHLCGEDRYLESARRILHLYQPQFAQQPAGMATFLDALEEALTPPRIIILGGPEAELRQWQRRLAAMFQAHTLILAPGTQPGLPEALQRPVTPRVNAWVCQGVSCLAPIADLAELITP